MWLLLPGKVGSVQLLKITRRRGVQYVDRAAVGLQRVDIADQFVQVLVPKVGILILEV